jgi:hypothetical protein
MSTPGRLEVDAGNGRVSGAASITYNEPWPCANGTPGGSGAMSGVVMHTMAGDLPGTIAWFNDPASEASAFFGIDQAGGIHQFGPLGRDWMAWAQAAGNPSWYSIEHADHEHPENPLTDAQVTASAQLLELLSRFAGFELQVSDSPDVEGYVCHSAGGQAWGGHLDCPGTVRADQRARIVELAREIRDGEAPKPKPVPEPVHAADLEGILVQLPGGTSRKVLSGDGGVSWR